MAFAVDDRGHSPVLWTGFAMMCIGMFMALLDTQVVVTSLPTIQRALSIPQEQMSWIQTAYLIAEIIAIPLTGLLTRALGTRLLFVFAVSLFTLASIGCASSASFLSLIVCRVLQGVSGGTLIPAVFSAVFLLFPFRMQTLATMIASVLAVLAPTIGPLVGGWVTETYSWQWLFLINVGPGLFTVVVAIFTLPKQALLFDELRELDGSSFMMGALALSTLEVAIKEAPDHGWTSPRVAGLLLASLITALGFVWRTLRVAKPLVDIRTFYRPIFSIACVLSFVVGMGLYGSIYLMPLFLAYVRGHNAFAIGEIMLVTGVAQLACAPLVAALLRRFDARALSAFGFLLLALGAALSTHQTRDTDFAGMFAGQLVRGCAFMFCVLPPTELALGGLATDEVADASGLFNLMRNLGGAVGIAIIDSIIFSRSPDHAHALIEGLMAGSRQSLSALGMAANVAVQAAADPSGRALLASLVKKVAYVESINDAWLALSVSAAAALLVLFFATGKAATKTQ